MREASQLNDSKLIQRESKGFFIRDPGLRQGEPGTPPEDGSPKALASVKA